MVSKSDAGVVQEMRMWDARERKREIAKRSKEITVVTNLSRSIVVLITKWVIVCFLFIYFTVFILRITCRVFDPERGAMFSLRASGHSVFEGHLLGVWSKVHARLLRSQSHGSQRCNACRNPSIHRNPASFPRDPIPSPGDIAGTRLVDE